ncbi:MAG: alpha/beta fold hydrolase [Reyranellales bacterium]
MTPVTFNGCFGWLHAPHDGVGGDVAVLICPGLMQDAILSYGSLRLLADQLAKAGYFVLRFDYPGTGDSCDEDIERARGHWTAWQQSVDRAADWLLATTGARRLVLGGLRLGTTLATLAAARRNDVAGLVLFEPVLSGQAYVRQIRLEGDLLRGQDALKSESLELREFRFSPETLAQMAAVDLRRVSLPAGLKVAIFTRTNSKLLDECMQAWNDAGVSVFRGDWEGLTPLVRHNIIDEDTLGEFHGVVQWLQGAVPVEAPARARGPITLEPATLRPSGCVETPLRFGPEGRLFGMLCRPDRATSEEVIIIGNAGHDPHYGSARQPVVLGRRLAAAGVASLRLDFAGLGDSIGPPGRENMLPHVFAVDRGPDIHAAVDALEALGFRRFGMAGLCSGAYHAFHCALVEPRVATVLVINLPFFTLPGGDVLGYLEQRTVSPGDHLRKLFRLASWTTLLSGKTDMRGVLRGQSARLRTTIQARIQGLARRLGLVREQSFARQAMATLHKRGARALFLFSPGEGETDAFGQEFGRAKGGLGAYPGSMTEVVPDMDHDLTNAVGRHTANTLMIEFVTGARGQQSKVDKARQASAALA